MVCTGQPYSKQPTRSRYLSPKSKACYDASAPVLAALNKCAAIVLRLRDCPLLRFERIETAGYRRFEVSSTFQLGQNTNPAKVSCEEIFLTDRSGRRQES